MLGISTRDRTAERRAATRLEILEAAWDVARERGLSQITLRDVADRVGMRPPSLYSHFDSKNAIYDAMFAQAWTECHELLQDVDDKRARTPRATLRLYAHAFFDFSVTDLARFQLMNQRTIPGFEPTAQSYAPAVSVLEATRELLSSFGLTRSQDVDLYTALIGGLIDAQLANDPGGTRWARLLDRTVEMYADNVGLPKK